MTEPTGLLDTYALRARLLPALLVVLPVGITLGLLLPTLDYQRVIVTVAVCAGVPIFLANTVRSRGKHLEAKLVTEWGGMPTTRMLRLHEQSNNRHELARRRERLEKVTGITLPTAEEEATDPGDADQIYLVATRALIVRVRETKDHYGLIQHENTDYGYRRNLTAIKPAGLTVLAALLVTDIISMIANMGITPIITATAIHIICALAWLLIVRQPWVREQAETYAKTLFEALEEPTLGAPQESANR
jgi:hypothetical protein